jgi:hypothetical protein
MEEREGGRQRGTGNIVSVQPDKADDTVGLQVDGAIDSN